MIELLQSIRADLLSRRLLPFVALARLSPCRRDRLCGWPAAPVRRTAPVANLPSVPVSGASTLRAWRWRPRTPTRPSPRPRAACATRAKARHATPSCPCPRRPRQTSESSGGSSSFEQRRERIELRRVLGRLGRLGLRRRAEEGTRARAQKAGQAPTRLRRLRPVRARLDHARPAGDLGALSNLKPGQPFPSKQDARISFERVSENGKGAVFKLLAAPILHGTGICLPSTSECQTIDLEAGHSEELEYIEANGQVVVYELKVVSIAKRTALARPR